MGARKKGATKVSDDADELARYPLQAILLADSFATKFRPITLERPKVLLPLVTVPMINYTLAWLKSAGVEKVFVFCCAHSRQVINYLRDSEWGLQPNFISIIESHNSASVGDALRMIYEKDVIHGDFVLISGDTAAMKSLSLTQALHEHKERRKKKGNNAVMTMLIQSSELSPITHIDEAILEIDPDTKQLLRYDEKSELHSKGKALLADNSNLVLHNDKQDCYIDICSPEVLSLFNYNFDYQDLRRDFVKGLLVDDIMGYKIFTHEIHSGYAARIDNFGSYDTISKGIIKRYSTYPFVPDVEFFGNSSTKLEREGIYGDSKIKLSHFAHIGPSTAIGKGTKIGDNSRISNSVIGRGCRIRSNVSIFNSYIWDNVTIEDGCELNYSVVCDGAIIKLGAVLERGVVLSFKAVIGSKIIVPAYSKVSLFQQPTAEDNDEEFSDSSIASIMDKLELSEKQQLTASEVGTGGVGHVWSIPEDEWRNSVAPIPADKLAEATQTKNDNSDDGATEEDFEEEVEATFLRAVDENIEICNVMIEINCLRLSFSKYCAECGGPIFHAMMKLALKMSYNSADDLLQNLASVLNTWQELLMFCTKDMNEDEQIEVILKFEEMCLESTQELSPHFAMILSMLYHREFLTEDAILRWADEKKDAEESDKVFVKQAECFIQWLREASEEED